MAKLTPIKRERFESFLRLIGCSLKRVKGDHFIYSRPGLKRPVVITADKEFLFLLFEEIYGHWACLQKNISMLWSSCKFIAKKIRSDFLQPPQPREREQIRT